MTKKINVKRLVLSGSVVAIAAIAVIGATGAFLSDQESSIGNIFTAGALDLKVDNDSYYNGNRCENVGGEEVPVWEWVGTADYPVPGTPCTTSWNLDDLSNGHLFFNFFDLKPDDEGEDTISLHVENDAWACMDLTLTSNDDNSSTEPELGAGDNEDVPEDNWDGELAQHLQMVWWADDGDNVLEHGENILTGDHTVGGGVETLYDLATTTPFSLAIADANGNIWGGDEPLPAGAISYIGKAWCFGTLTINPVPADQGQNPSVDPGVICDGTAIPNVNAIQTDGATLDVQFRTEQARHNPGFLCEPDNDLCDEVDVMIVLDRSSSIDAGELTTLKTAATNFVNSLAPSDPGAKVGLVSFGTEASLDEGLTFIASDVTDAIDAIVVPPAGAFTNLQHGIELATAELATNGRPGIPDKIVVITDGAPTASGNSGDGNLVTGPVTDPPTVNSAAASAEALAADGAGIEIFVAGIGTNATTETYLENDIATVPGNFFSAGNFDALEAILQNLADCPNREAQPD